ncbi:MAG: fasciclin domain-containing protein [Planctomycetota bacterium]|nr:fasciclin domain-containing protein [Planctomycetota bacterium]
MFAQVAFITLAAAAALTPLLGDTSCSSTTAAVASEKKDIVDTAVGAGSFKTLAAALGAAGLVNDLKGKGPFTVFAPTDEAFARLPKGTLEKLLEPKNKLMLQSILTYHVVSGSVAAADVVKLQNATTLGGQRIAIRVTDGGVFIDDAKVTMTDIACSNGIIHVVDAVLMPSTDDIVATAVKAGSFKTLAAALEAAGLVEALQGEGPFTVFAPTDEAFASLPKGTVEGLLKPENREKLAALLKHHVVKGRVFADAAGKGANVTTLAGTAVKTRSADGQVFVNEARVVKADIDAKNGVIHVIDRVLGVE